MAKQSVLTRSKKAKAVKLMQQNRVAEARTLWAQVCRADPADFEAWLNVGALSGQLQDYDDAMKAFQRVLQLRPDTPQAHFNLGRLHELYLNFAEAATHYHHYVRLKPSDEAGVESLCLMLLNQNRLDDAHDVCRKALDLRPDSARLHNCLANVLQDLGQFDQALVCYERSLALGMSKAQVFANMGNLHHARGDFAQALERYQQALALQPDSVETLASLGFLYSKHSREIQALECFDRALALAPHNSNVRWNRALVLLRLGRFEDGWVDYEARLSAPDAVRQFGRRRFAKPVWDGRPRRDQTLLVYAEQGLGDTLQFCRYLPLAADRVKRIVFECQPPLVPLLSALPGVASCIAKTGDGEPAVEFDTYIPLLSLPGVFGTALDTIPARYPYVQPSAPQVDSWRRKLPRTLFKVGLVWAGNPRNPNDRRRSVALSAFAPLAAIAGVCFISLQLGPAAQQAGQPPAAMDLVDVSADIGDFADTAAIVANLDLVISVDTAVAHLAGALGVPVWTLVYTPPDWRWLLDRDDSPWYPSMRLFRQDAPGEWGPVIERLASALATQVDRHG